MSDQPYKLGYDPASPSTYGASSPGSVLGADATDGDPEALGVGYATYVPSSDPWATWLREEGDLAADEEIVAWNGFITRVNKKAIGCAGVMFEKGPIALESSRRGKGAFIRESKVDEIIALLAACRCPPVEKPKKWSKKWIEDVVASLDGCDCNCGSGPDPCPPNYSFADQQAIEEYNAKYEKIGSCGYFFLPGCEPVYVCRDNGHYKDCPIKENGDRWWIAGTR